MSSTSTSSNGKGPGVKAKAHMREDGYANIINGRHSPWGHTPIPGPNRLYSNMTKYWHDQTFHGELEAMYLARGVASIIVDRPADDCFAKGVKIEGDEDNAILPEFDRLSVMTKFADALRWSRLFGASVILIMAKDGGSWDTELNLDSIDTIEELKVYDLRHVKPTDKLYTDETNPLFGKPEIFTIHPPGGETFEVHETRLIPFTGDPLPASTQSRLNVWWVGKPALYSCMTSLQRLEHAYEWALRLLERKQQGVYKMEGLGDLFAQEMDDIVTKRINLVDMVRSTLNSVVVDANDEYTVQNLGLDNVQNVINEYQIAVCSDSGFPSVILFGKSATSLNSTGAGELENYYGLVGRIRQRVCSPALERLVSILWLQADLKGSIPDEWEIDWPPLWVPSEKEQADTELVENQAKNSEVDMLLKLMDAGILMPEEVRKIIVAEYDDYNFPDSAPSTGGDTGYASDVGGGEDGSQTP